MTCSSYSMMNAIRKLDDVGQMKVCHSFHRLIRKKSLRGDFIDRFEETYALLDEDNWDLTSGNLHYAINDLDNALFCIDYNNCLLFMEVYEELQPTIEDCTNGRQMQF